MDWTAGYVADIAYTFGYYPELNPLRLKLAFLNAGLAVPEIGAACELGFGQGISANIHAAASVTQWYGTDFNPSQASFARELADVAGSSARLFDQGFAEFCTRTDLPEFDYIGLHGIWSWISDENRHIIIDFIRRKLKVGGVLYISYNTLPGWSTMVPLRHLLTRHADTMAAPGDGIVKRIDNALEFADKLLATNPLYLRANPGIADRLDKMKGLSRNYLAHEYFNRDWHPMPFAQMVEWMKPTKLHYVCSANHIANLDSLNLLAEQRELLKDVHDQTFRETVRDFMVNQQFRKDYWVKGGRQLSALDRGDALRAYRLMLQIPRAKVEFKTRSSIGDVTMSEAIYGPIVDQLADHRPRSLGQLEKELAPQNISLSQILEAALVLSETSTLAAVQDEKVVARARPQTERLNAFLLNKARGSDDIQVLASPVTGGGVLLNRFEQLFLLARLQGRKTPEQWAEFVWDIIQAQGQRLAREGRTLETAQENLAEILREAQGFSERRLPLLKALGVAA